MVYSHPHIGPGRQRRGQPGGPGRHQHTPDTTPPSLTTAEVNATSLVLTYDEALDAASVPATTDFAIDTSGAAQSVGVVAVSGTTLTLTLSPGVANGDTVSYTANVTPIQDLAGNDAASLVGQAVTNSTPATTPPSLTTAEVNTTSLVLTYDEALDAASVPATIDFAIDTSGAA